MEASLGSTNTKRGWLLKRGGLFKKSFVKRYYVLRGNVLEKYASPADSVHGPFKAKGVQKMVEVADVRPNTSIESKIPKYAFDIYFLNGDIVTFGAENAAERENWVKAFSVFMFAQQKANAKSILEGNLEHSQDHGKSWEEQYVVLFPDRILVYEGGKDDKDKAHEVHVLVFTADFYVGDAPGGQFAFQVSDFNVSYYFGTKDEQSRFFWMHAIARIIRKLQTELETLEIGGSGQNEREMMRLLHRLRWKRSGMEHRGSSKSSRKPRQAQVKKS